MSWVYLSHLLKNDTPLYGGKGEVIIKNVRSISAGDASNNTELCMPVHAGTHIDAPFHFDPEGKTLDDYFADYWYVSKTALIDCPMVLGSMLSLEHIGKELSNIPKDIDLLLIRTGAEKWRETARAFYSEKGLCIGSDVAEWVRCNLNLKFLGVDCISVSSPLYREEGRRTHRVLLGKHHAGSRPVLIIEDMALAHLHRAPQEVWIVPIRFQKADGAMLTVLARVS